MDDKFYHGPAHGGPHFHSGPPGKRGLPGVSPKFEVGEVEDGNIPITVTDGYGQRTTDIPIDSVVTDERLTEKVDDWLDDHPEATTTVQDGSITVTKFHSSVVDSTLTQSGHPADAAAVGATAEGLDDRLQLLEDGAPEIISEATQDWLDDHVTPAGSAVIVDNSLTQSGAAADAKKTGDELSDLKSDLNYNHTAEPGYVLRATNTGHGNEWAMVGTPTDAQAATAINAWLDAHPEATTTVQDGSLTLPKFKEGELPFVTPEQFGAIGDGVVDDTEAWQSAVNSGFAVKATRKAYKIGTIQITTDLLIDCNDATFIVTEKIGFNCVGTIGEEASVPDYEAFSEYDCGITFSGLARIKGTNNAIPQRSYYVGGSIEKFVDGHLIGTIPVDITGATIAVINPIKVDIKNVSSFSFLDDDLTDTKFIKQTFCAFSKIEAISMSGVCYSAISLEQCYSCYIDNANIDFNELFISEGANCYPVGLIDSSNTVIDRSFINNINWHAVSTGGTILCRKTAVYNSALYSDYTTGYDDHENGLETTIYNSSISSVLIGGLGTIENVKITGAPKSNRTAAQPRLNVHMYSDARLARYTLKSIKYNKSSDVYGVYCLLDISNTAAQALTFYIDNLTIKDCERCDGGVITVSTTTVGTHTGSLVFNRLFSENTKIGINTAVFSSVFNSELMEHRFYVNSKYYFFYKSGRLVTFTSPQDIQNGASGVNVIGTLPKMFWPPQNVLIPVANATDSTYIIVSSDGIVQLVLSTATTSARNGAFSGAWYTNN